jgi:hypothetical protein
MRISRCVDGACYRINTGSAIVARNPPKSRDTRVLQSWTITGGRDAHRPRTRLEAHVVQSRASWPSIFRRWKKSELYPALTANGISSLRSRPKLRLSLRRITPGTNFDRPYDPRQVFGLSPAGMSALSFDPCRRRVYWRQRLMDHSLTQYPCLVKSVGTTPLFRKFLAAHAEGETLVDGFFRRKR